MLMAVVETVKGVGLRCCHRSLGAMGAAPARARAGRANTTMPGGEAWGGGDPVAVLGGGGDSCDAPGGGGAQDGYGGRQKYGGKVGDGGDE